MERSTIEPADSPYLLPYPPTSSGRIVLMRAFEHYCALHWGYSPLEIAEALEDRGDRDVIANVAMGTRIIGEAFSMGAVLCSARPKGGGEPVALRASAWEIDDFRQRFASCAIDPKTPFDPEATSHWIFVEMDGWNALVETTLGEGVRSARRRSAGTPARGNAGSAREEITGVTDMSGRSERLVRLDEVKHRTGMSRSTIYRRMGNGQFPRTVTLDGSMAAWREADIDAWIDDPGPTGSR